MVQPPNVPELNPVERFFQELRRAIESRVYPDLQAKQEALEEALNAWQADPERVRRLCGWGLDPEGPQGPARRNRSGITIMDWYYAEEQLSGEPRQSIKQRPYDYWTTTYLESILLRQEFCLFTFGHRIKWNLPVFLASFYKAIFTGE